MAEKSKKHTETIAIVMVIVILLLLLWWWFSNQNGSPAASTPQNVVTIPPADTSSGQTPLSAGTVNVNWAGPVMATGVSTYIPLFGFLRYGAFFG